MQRLRIGWSVENKLGHQSQVSHNEGSGRCVERLSKQTMGKSAGVRSLLDPTCHSDHEHTGPRLPAQGLYKMKPIKIPT